MTTKQQKFIVIHEQGNCFLYRFTIGFFNDDGDDPTCWCNERKDAKAFTQAQIDKMHQFIVGFQGQYTLAPV